jgi:hypothetical protein
MAQQDGISGSVPNRWGDNDWPTPVGTYDSAEKNQSPYEASVGGLLGWCVERISQCRDERDERYEDRWKEYTRIWRGMWAPNDKNTDSERSKLISPATMQAIEATVAEMEEATFAKEAWFDIEDDLEDEDKDDATAARDLLLEEFEINGITAAITQCYLLGAVYGTGIGKINVREVKEDTLKNGQAVERTRIAVTLDPIRPDQFIIDTSALNVYEAEFCAHEIQRPQHIIHQKQAEGLYRSDVEVGTWNGEHRADTEGNRKYEHSDSRDRAVLITEYFGKVPAEMLPGYDGPDAMPEAIIVIANESVILKAIPSPFTMKDRPIVAYAHDVVPGEFWGRGLAEKGYNPQKALDTELRARIDALAITNAPMMGADITRLPRSPDMRIRPGKTVFTRGNPKEIFSPIEMGSQMVLQSTWQHASDMERMVTMATGAMDSAAPLNQNRRNETASGMSMMGGSFIKRSKRAMGNVERTFLTPFIRKSLWRYMQFDPQRFKKDVKFLPKATMGIMAKEVENAQLINMLGFLEPKSPEYNIVVKAIFDNSASANKAELNAAMEQMLAPPSPEEQKAQQEAQALQKEMVQLEVEQSKKDIEKTNAEIEKLQSETFKNKVMADLEDDKVDIQAANAVTGAEKARMGQAQNKVAQDRNEIERLKIRQGANNNGSKS